MEPGATQKIIAMREHITKHSAAHMPLGQLTRPFAHWGIPRKPTVVRFIIGCQISPSRNKVI